MQPTFGRRGLKRRKRGSRRSNVINFAPVMPSKVRIEQVFDFA